MVIAESPVSIVTNALPAAWDAFAAAHGTRYHLWGWKQVFEEAFGHQTVYLAALRNGRAAATNPSSGANPGEITGILPLVVMQTPLFGRFAVSLPFVDGGGLCAVNRESADALLAHARALAIERGLSHIEMRHVQAQCPALPVRQHKVGMQLALPGTAAAAWEALDRKVRNQVRKAEKSGLAARHGGAELVDAFYRIFAQNMRDLGTPVYSRKLFETVFAVFAATTRVFVVELEGQPVAAGIAMQYGDAMAVPWASSLREHRALCPNNLLYWRAIEYAIAQRCTIFDFGRSTEGQGTYQFKAQWGALPVPLHWEYVLLNRASLPDLSPANPKFSVAIEAWKRLPLPVASWLGPHIVRHLP
jgi:FemAB-related protein (PEP-CTERM system-associated)